MNLTPIRRLVQKTKQCDPKMLGCDTIVYIDISSIDRQTKRIAEPQILAADEAPSRARKQVHADDVLVSTVRPNLNNVALVPSEYHDEIASTGFCVLRANKDVLDPLYLFYFTQTTPFVSRLTQLSIGAGYPAVSDDNILDTEIPRPTLPEQQRIAAILAKADRLRRLRRTAHELGDTYLQSVFLEMFDEYLAEGHPTTPLGELVTITGGGTPSRRITRYYEGDIPWLTSKDMQGDYIFDTQEHVTEEAIENSAAKLVPAGSILIVVKSKVLMHRVPMAIAMRVLCHGQDIKSVQCSEETTPYFLIHVLKHNESRLLSQARGANTEGLTLPMLREIPVPDVPLPLQERFAQVVQQYARLRAQQREAERQAEHLFRTLLQRAFRGEL